MKVTPGSARSNRTSGPPKPGRGAKGCGGCFFVVFFVLWNMFALGFLGMFAKKYLRVQEAKSSWPQATAYILESKVLTVSGDSNTYRPEMTFTYEFQGGVYQATGYDLWKISTSSRAEQERASASFLVGGRYPCYVNPENPQEAVLSLDWPEGAGMMIWIPSLFLFIGIAIPLGIWIANRRQGSPKVVPGTGDTEHLMAMLPVIPRIKTRPGTLLTHSLDSRLGPLAGVLGIGFIAIVWNGITMPILILKWGELKTGELVILGIFGSIGLLLLFALIHSILRWLLVPHPHLEISAEPAAPGERIRILLSQRGAHRVTSGHLKVRCVERTIYRVGTNTQTSEKVLFTEELWDTAEMDTSLVPLEVQREYQIPENRMHSFHSGNNTIEWQFEFKLEIAGKPDVKEEFVFRVLPDAVRRVVKS